MNDSEKKKRLKKLLNRKPQKIAKPKLPKSTGIKTLDLSGSTEPKRKKPFKLKEAIDAPLIKIPYDVPKKFDYKNPVLRVAIMSSFGPKRFTGVLKTYHESNLWMTRAKKLGISPEEYRNFLRDKEELKKAYAGIDPIKMTAKKAYKFGHNLGFSTKSYIKKYGNMWQIQLARDIRNVQGEAYHKAKLTPMFREAVAFTNWYFKNKKKYEDRPMGKFEFQIVYGNRKISFSDTEKISSQLRMLISLHPANEYEFTQMLKVREKQVKLPKWHVAYLNYSIADPVERLMGINKFLVDEAYNKKSIARLMNELWMETALKMRELHKASLTKIPELTDMEQREFKESEYGELSYEELKEVIYEAIDNDKEVNIDPKVLMNMAYSKKFEEKFMPKLVEKYGEEDARYFYLRKIVQGEASFRKLTSEANLKDGWKARASLIRRYRNHKDFSDALRALYDHFNLMTPEDRAESMVTPLKNRYYLDEPWSAADEGQSLLAFPVSKRSLRRKIKRIESMSEQEKEELRKRVKAKQDKKLEEKLKEEEERLEAFYTYQKNRYKLK